MEDWIHIILRFICLLDIGNLLSSESLYHVRYTTTTLDFWFQNVSWQGDQIRQGHDVS